MNISAWQFPPQRLDLPAGELHLWKIDLSLIEVPEVLNQQEKQRAERLVVGEKKQQFSMARSVLRHILSWYLDKPPAELVFAYNADGKPYLQSEPLHFNLSHSRHWAVLALSNTFPVGVDLEYTGKDVSRESLVDRFFNPAEKRAYISSPQIRQKRQFYRLWTKKESLLKLSGHGWRGLSSQPPEGGVSRHFVVAKNYLSCVSFSSRIASIKKYQYP